MISSEINDNDNADSHEQIENTERSPHSASSPITTSPSDIATPCGVATESSSQSQDQSLSGNVKKKKGKENWQLHSTHGSKESAMDIIMKPYKHVVKHTTKLIRGISTTYVCTVHVNCEHCYKLIEKQLPDDRRSQWTLSQLNKHSTALAPKPRGIDPAIRAKVDEYACLGASPLHILETLVASGEVKRDELPTRDQISNRIHGRESKKRKTQMEAMQLQKQRSIELHQRQQQQLLEQQHLLQQQQKKQVQQQQHQHRQNLLQQQQYLQHQQQHQQQLVQQHLQLQQQLPFTYRPTSRSLEFEYETHNAEAYEQACLDLFGPNLLYHSVYYQEYGMGMVVSVSTDTIAAPINLNYPTDQIPPMSAPSNVPGAIPVNTSDAQINSELQGITITTLESLGQVQIPPIHHNHHRHNRQHHQLQHQHPHHPFLMIRPKLGDPLASTPLLSSSSASSGPSIHESIPLPESTVPRMSTMYSTPPPPPLQWTLLFIHTPPDENGYYMQCPLGCPDCVNGKVHLVVNRTLLLSGLMGAIDLAHAGSPSPAIHSTVLSSFQNGSSYYQPSHDVPPNVTYDPTPTSTSTSTHHSNIHPHQSL